MQHTQQQQLSAAVSRASWRQVSAERRACPDDGSIGWAIETAGAEIVRTLLDDPRPFALLAAAAAERADDDAQLALCLLAAIGGRRTRAVWRSRQQRGGRSLSRRRRPRGGERSFATAADGLRAGLARLEPAAA